jgi:hypothetical protein
MKKILYLSIAALGLCTIACTKNNESVKKQIETTLPSIELTSMGLLNQVGPFSTSDAIQVSFNGAVTNNGAGSFDFAWYDGSARVDSAHFPKWDTTVSAGGTKVHTIATKWAQTTYANTWAFSGNLTLQLGKLTGAGKAYTLYLYARASDNKVASVSVSKFITMK